MPPLLSKCERFIQAPLITTPLPPRNTPDLGHFEMLIQENEQKKPSKKKKPVLVQG